MNQQINIYESLVDELESYYLYKKRTAKRIKELEETGCSCMDMRNYDINKIFERCYQFIAEQKPDFALVQIVENINTFIASVNTFDKSDLELDNPIQLSILSTLKKILATYKEWKSKESKSIADQFKNTWLFTEAELQNENLLDPRLIVYIENTIKQNLFKLYFYKQGEGVVNRTTKFLIYPTIGISHSLEEWFSFIDKQQAVQLKDNAVVTLFLKLDYASPHFSSFVISIHQKDSIWIASDQIDFQNPRNKQTSRKPERHKESHYDNIGLPYGIAFNIDKIRQDQNSVLSSKDIDVINIDLRSEQKFMKEAIDKQLGDNHSMFSRNKSIGVAAVARRILKEKKIVWEHERECLYANGNVCVGIEYKRQGRVLAVVHFAEKEPTRLVIYKRAEILFKKFTEIDAHDRMYFVKLIERFFEELEFDPPKERVMLGQQYIEQKLLTGGVFSYDDNGFVGFKKDHKAILNDMVETLNSEERSIAKMSYELVLNSPEYETSWLGTPAALDNLARWCVLEGEAKVIKEDIENRIKPRKDEDTQAIVKMLKERIDPILLIAFSGNETFTLQKFGGMDWSMESKGNKDFKWVYFMIEGDKQKYGMRFSSFSSLRLFWEWPYRGRKARADQHDCEFCNENKILNDPVLRFEVRHYAQLMVLLGLKERSQLPLYFQNYRAHDQIPYHGNSILNNVHPYSLINDPCSNNYTNGLYIDIYMCKRCYNRIKKEKTQKQL